MIVAVFVAGFIAVTSTYAAPTNSASFKEYTGIGDLQSDETDSSYVHVYGDKKKDNDDKGYHRTTENKGSDGYKHFDSYHKKDSDKYGYESHSAHGNANHGSYDGGNVGTSSKAATDSDGKGSQVNYQYIEHLDSDHLGDFNDGVFGSYTDGHGSESNYHGYSGPEHYEAGGYYGGHDGFDEYYSH